MSVPSDHLEFMLDLFNPIKFNSERGLKMLHEHGGISSLLNGLNVSHRQGLPHYTDHTRRVEIYGMNSAPSSENLLRKFLSQQRDFMVNLLLYVLILKVCIKLLLWRSGMLNPEWQPQEGLVSSIWKEVVCYILLLGMVYLKAMVNVKYFHLDTDERKYKVGKVRVRRDGEEFDIDESGILVGDIMILDRNNTIRVDGILLDSRRLLVSEAHTILRRDASNKQALWGQQNSMGVSDPFMLAGSKVVSGTGEMLVCLVGQHCSFRRTQQYMSNFLQQTPVIKDVKKILEYVQNLGKFFSLILTLLAIYWFVKQEDITSHKAEHNIFPEMFNHILKIIASFIAMTCMLQRLKIIRSLKFFIEGNLSGTYYRIKNKEAIERLSEVDVIFLEESVISRTITSIRDQEVTQIQNIGILSMINNYYQLKIVTPENKAHCENNYGSDIPDSEIYAQKRSMTAEDNLDSLMAATFITQCSTMKFINELLPIYQSLNYKIAYVSNAQNLQNSNFPPHLLHITFQKIGSRTDRCIENEWVRFQNRLMAEQILEDLIYKSFAFAKLYNAYMAMTLNNVCIFFTLSWYSIKEGVEFDLAWTLAIIIINRYTFFSIYGRVAMESRYKRFSQRSKWQAVKFNLFLFPYFLYVINHLKNQVNIFFFLLANSLFRVQSLLFSIDKKRSFGYWLRLLGLTIVIHLLNIVISGGEEEEVRNIAYTLGLALIYSGYVFVA